MNYRDDQLTDWFPPEVKPVRAGVYYCGALGYAHWNGTRWGAWQDTPLLARKFPDYENSVQDKWWRALNFNPVKS